MVYVLKFLHVEWWVFFPPAFKDRFVMELKPVSFIYLLLRKSTCHSVSSFHPSKGVVFVRINFFHPSALLPCIPSSLLSYKSWSRGSNEKNLFFFFESHACIWKSIQYSGLPLISSPLILIHIDRYPQISCKQGDMNSTVTIFFFPIFATGL